MTSPPLLPTLNEIEAIGAQLLTLCGNVMAYVFGPVLLLLTPLLLTVAFPLASTTANSFVAGSPLSPLSPFPPAAPAAPGRPSAPRSPFVPRGS